MANPIHEPRYQLFRQLLTEERLQSGLLQADIAKRLGKPQSFMSKVEIGERRLDLTEFLEIADILKLDTEAFIKRYKAALKKNKF